MKSVAMNEDEVNYTVEEGFNILMSNLDIPQEELAIVSSRQFEIENYLSMYINTFVTVMPGAFARNTMIAPLKGNTIDMLFLLRQEHSNKYTPSELLEKLFVTLEDEYPNVVRSRDGRGAILGFPECTFKVMPGFTINEGGYLVPAYSGGYWVKSDPARFQKQLEKADKACKGWLFPAIKMLKCWNHSVDNIFHGYYLELLALEVLAGTQLTSHASVIKHVLNKGKLKIAFRTEDPAVENELLDGLRDVTMIVQGMLCFQNAHEVASEASHQAGRTNNKQAFIEWDRLFRGYFPTPVSMVIHKLQNSDVQGAKALEIMRDSMKR